MWPDGSIGRVLGLQPRRTLVRIPVRFSLSPMRPPICNACWPPIWPSAGWIKIIVCESGCKAVLTVSATRLCSSHARPKTGVAPGFFRTSVLERALSIIWIVYVSLFHRVFSEWVNMLAALDSEFTNGIPDLYSNQPRQVRATQSEMS